MKYILITAALILAAAATACGIVYVLSDKPEIRAARKEGDAMAWMRAEFKLNDEQVAKIEAVHSAYGKVCAVHCRDVQAAMDALAALKADRAASPEQLAAAEQKLRATMAVCEEATAAHVKNVATYMSPEQGARYLALVLPRITGYHHKGPPDLGVHKH